MCIWPVLAAALLVDGKQRAAVLRIKALWRLRCCALPVFCSGGAGAPDYPNFDAVHVPPGLSQLARSQLSTIGGEAQRIHTLPDYETTPRRFAGEARVPPWPVSSMGNSWLQLC
jgi:hypothetical protein